MSLSAVFLRLPQTGCAVNSVLDVMVVLVYVKQDNFK